MGTRPILNDYRDDVPIWKPNRGPLIFSLIILLCTLSILVLFANRRLTVTINNRGDVALQSVTVHVTGSDHSVGNVAPLESVSTEITPRGESHVEIGFLDTESNPYRLSVGCYLESGYSGNISIDIDESRIVKVRDDVAIY